MRNTEGALLVTIAGVVAAAGLAAFGFLIKRWIDDLGADIRQLGGGMHDVADSMTTLDRRLTRIEARHDMHETVAHGMQPGGRRWYDHDEPPAGHAGEMTGG